MQDNEKSRDILIEQRFHKQLIGQRGESIREIRDRFNQVQISLPDSAKKSDIVTLRGPKNDVDECFQYLSKLSKELVSWAITTVMLLLIFSSCDLGHCGQCHFLVPYLY